MKLRAYIESVIDEMFHKVTWPSWSELQSSAYIVLVSSVMVALLVWLMDFTFGIQGSLNDGNVIWRGVLGFVYKFIS